MRVAFVIQHGEARYGFFDDTLLSLLCADARSAGHEAEVVHVFFDGRSADRDAAVRAELKAWLAERRTQLVVVERCVDLPSLTEFAQSPECTLVQVTRGDSLDPAPGASFIVGALPGLTSHSRVARTPSIDSLRQSFEDLLRCLRSGSATEGVAGVTRLVDGELLPGPPIEPNAKPRPFEPVVEHQVIALDAPPASTHKTVFGNVGCPYAQDPYKLPHFLGAEAPERVGLSRLGCAFCPMGGDYQVRADPEVIASLITQAQYYVEALPKLEALVLSDQAPVRYLAGLMHAAGAAQIRPLRWLFPCRADAFLREDQGLVAAIEAACGADQILECYLIGFEALCQRELDRYNKGVQVSELVQSVERMRELKANYPDNFDYARARGHSLVLFNPWTSPQDVFESTEALRQHGLLELFDEIARNRLRLYSDLPITYAAKRDGALEVKNSIGSGAGRRKGYSQEIPWRFLDPRTQVLADVSELLRGQLGTESELSQLRAAATLSLSTEGLELPQLDSRLSALTEAVGDLLHDERRPAGLPRARTQRAAAVLFAGACNNGCVACPNRDRFFSDDEDALSERVGSARQHAKPVLFAGREPSMHPALFRLLQAARGEDARAVGVVSNGRRFSYPAFTEACVQSGLRAASIKLFAPTATTADQISRAEGAHAQALEGLHQLSVAGIALEIRAPMHRANLDAFEEFAAIAGEFGASLRVEINLEALGLTALEEAAGALRRLIAACISARIALEAAPLSAATRDFRYLPLPAGPTGRRMAQLRE